MVTQIKGAVAMILLEYSLYDIIWYRHSVSVLLSTLAIDRWFSSVVGESADRRFGSG